LTAVLPAMAFSKLGDLLVDPAQGARGPAGAVLVVDDLVSALVGRAGGHGWVSTCQSGICWSGCS
jgi:hypothetical protein